VVRDDDQKPTEKVEVAFIANGGQVFAWRDGRTLEDELFLSLTDDAVTKLIDSAIDLHGDELINAHIKSVSKNAKDLDTICREALFDGFTRESRLILGKAARTRKAGWFKSVTWMEDVARDIVGPDLVKADAGFKALVEDIFAWSENAGEMRSTSWQLIAAR
jgi:putative ATP-dependent endonuclease of the OLD family